MQIVENSTFGVRAVIYRFSHRDSRLEFELYPMIHIGEQRYFDDIRHRANRCDAILYEGVASTRVRILVISYKLIAMRKRLGLVCQSNALPRSAIDSKMVHADISAPDFSRFWARVPRWQRLLFYMAAPVVGILGYLTASRESLARRCEAESLPSRDEILARTGGLTAPYHALRTHRDEHLVACVLKCHNDFSIAQRRIGIMYGAAHMSAVIHFLRDELGYGLKSAEWVTVFSL